MWRLTGGHLPLTAFRHLEPTAIGIVDLDRSIRPRTPDGRDWAAGQRDGLLLIRLHDQPLAVIYTDGRPDTLTEEDLVSAIWEAAGAGINRHIGHFNCVMPPASSEISIGGTLRYSDQCAGCDAPKADGSVAVVVPTVGREEQRSAAYARCSVKDAPTSRSLSPTTGRQPEERCAS